MKMLVLFVLLCCSFQGQTKQDKLIDVKCFVELIGGGETITFWNISSKKLSGLADAIIGHQVSIPTSKQKVSIYKTHECVLLNEDFSSSKGKLLDAETAR